MEKGALSPPPQQAVAAATPAPPSPSDSISAKGGSALGQLTSTMDGRVWMRVPAQLLQKLCGYSTLIAAIMSTSYRAELAQASERYYYVPPGGGTRKKIQGTETHPFAGPT